jgi:hypothetical protein
VIVLQTHTHTHTHTHIFTDRIGETQREIRLQGL